MAALKKLPAMTRYTVSVDVPRSRGLRAWNTAAAPFEEWLAAQVKPPVLGAQIDTETRRGRDYVAVRVTVMVEAVDVAQAVALAWEVFRSAAGEVGGWDMAAAAAEVRPTDDGHGPLPWPASSRASFSYSRKPCFSTGHAWDHRSVCAKVRTAADDHSMPSP
jgi:hypothetical protein